MTRLICLVLALGFLLLASGVYLWGSGQSRLSSADRDGDKAEAKAVLKNAAGGKVAKVTFEDDDDGVRVKVVPLDAALPAGFHGFHVHANDDPANGTGCAAPSFVSADGHLKASGQDHPSHQGDMPVLLVMVDGTTEARFVTDRFSVGDIIGRAVIIHANPDNYANIPLGAAGDQYTANSPAATAATAATGNAGARTACGVIEAD